MNPLSPADDLGRHHALGHLMVAVESIGTAIEDLATSGGDRPALRQPDDLDRALAGIVVLAERIRMLAAQGQRP